MDDRDFLISLIYGISGWLPQWTCWFPSVWSLPCPSYPPALLSFSFRNEWIRPSICSLSVEFSHTFTGWLTFSGIWWVSGFAFISLNALTYLAADPKSLIIFLSVFWYSVIMSFLLLWWSWSLCASNKKPTSPPPTCLFLLFCCFYMGKTDKDILMQLSQWDNNSSSIRR